MDARLPSGTVSRQARHRSAAPEAGLPDLQSTVCSGRIRHRAAERLTWRRSSVFAIVGAIGLAVQVGALWLLAGVFHMPLITATFLATEIAVLHNFAWHVRWTWADRPASAGEIARRLVRFHVTNGCVSIGGNLLLMSLLAGLLRLHYAVASLLSVGATALINLAISNAWVFRADVGRRAAPEPAGDAR